MFRLFPLFLLLLLFTLGGLVAAQPSMLDAVAHRSGELIIRIDDEADLNDYKVLKRLPRSGLAVVAVARGREQAELGKIRARGKFAHVNRIARAFFSPNDPIQGFQWHFPAVQMSQAWELSSGSGVTVAVLDTGLASGAVDGINCVLSPYNAIDQSNVVEDGDGHGTHVAGTIAQATDNGLGVAGMAFGACIMPVKVLGDDGSGSFADIVEGIYYAVDSGAHVINMSLGTNARARLRSDPVMDAALDYAEANGVTVVCAAGNDSFKRNVAYPAIHPTTIAVGATDFTNAVVGYSNRGDGLDMVAPGGNTAADANGDGYADGVLQETRINGTWGYYFFQGTSMASPHVAGAAALLIAAGAAEAPSDVRTALFSSALDIGESGFDKHSGHGLLQVFDALTGGPTAPPPPPPPPSGTDADGDGWTVEDGDCDDSNPDVYPGHADRGRRWGRDGIDNDCDGLIDR